MSEMICKCCHEKKPTSEFYRSGSGYMRRCKKCVSLDNKLRKLWDAAQQDDRDYYEQWSDELKDIVATFVKYYKDGGKVDYSNSPALELIAIYAEQNPDEFVDTKAGASDQDFEQIKDAIESVRDHLGKTTDALIQLVDAVAKLNLRVGIVEGKKLVTSKNCIAASNIYTDTPHDICFNPSGSEVQERAKLIDQVSGDKELLEAFGAEEHSKLIGDLKELFSMAVVQRYINPKYIRNIVSPFEDFHVKLPDAMLILYRKFIKPGFAATKARDDYHELVDICSAFTGTNYYEEPWESIPTL